VPAGSRQQAGVLAWALGGLRLLLEWLMVPLFGVALQLPQGALCYWASSSGLALLQNVALRRPAARAALGLPTAPPQPGQQQPTTATNAGAGAAAAVAGTAGGLPSAVDPALRSFLLATSDQAALFARAAELRAEGRAGAACAVLQHLLHLHPGQPNALMALGQLRAALGDWALSEQLLLQAAASDQVAWGERAGGGRPASSALLPCLCWPAQPPASCRAQG
jgi:tetratricopeptide (TPR) repeat protein